jgi:hypothetical protein
VQSAYIAELLWLVEQVDPEYVFVGVETDGIYEFHPEWWDDFVSIQSAVYDGVKSHNSQTHVTTYFTLPWMVDDNGQLNSEHAEVWRQLLPKIDSIAFSSYPSYVFSDREPDEYPAGYFVRAGEVAPELPIVIPEFGITGGGISIYSEAEQVQALSLILEELSTAEVQALVWFQANDNLILAQPIWLQEAFQNLGMIDLHGRSKESLALWKLVHDLPLE